MYNYTTICIKEIQDKTVHMFKNTLLPTSTEAPTIQYADYFISLRLLP